MLASCWHVSDYESAPLWTIYRGSSRSVAIRSTVHRLMTALGDPPPAEPGFHRAQTFERGMAGCIHYRTDRIPANNYRLPFYRKRKSFQHEKELRVTLLERPVRDDGFFDQQRQPLTPGRLIPVGIHTLVQSAFVSPGASGSHREEIQRLIASHGLNLVVRQSDLDVDPLYQGFA